MSEEKKSNDRSAGSRAGLDETLGRYDSLMAACRFDEAHDVLEQLLSTARSAGDRSLELTALSELMGHCRQTGRRDEGIGVCLEGIALLQDLSLDRAVSGGTVMINAATCLHSFGENGIAKQLFHAAERAYFENLPADRPEYAALYNNMASVYETEGDLASAAGYYKKALVSCESELDRAVTHINIAQVYHRSGSTQARDESISAAMGIFNDPSVVWDTYYAHTCRKCAGALEAMGHAAQGKELTERADIISAGS